MILKSASSELHTFISNCLLGFSAFLYYRNLRHTKAKSELITCPTMFLLFLILYHFTDLAPPLNIILPSHPVNHAPLCSTYMCTHAVTYLYAFAHALHTFSTLFAWFTSPNLPRPSSGFTFSGQLPWDPDWVRNPSSISTTYIVFITLIASLFPSCPCELLQDTNFIPALLLIQSLVQTVSHCVHHCISSIWHTVYNSSILVDERTSECVTPKWIL